MSLKSQPVRPGVLPPGHDSEALRETERPHFAWAEVIVRTGVFLLVTVLVLLPVLFLIYGSLRTSAPGAPGEFTLANYREALSARYLPALLNTLKVSAMTAVICAFTGTLLAWLVFRTNMPGRRWMAVLLTSTFYFPSFLTAEAWTILLAPRTGLLNNLLRSVFPGFAGLDIYTLAGITWVMVLAYVPYTFLFLAGPFQSLDPSLEEAATMAGARRLRLFFTISLPLVSYAIISGALLTFILSAGVFGVPAVIGMPARIWLLSTQIFGMLQFYPSNYSVAAALASILMAITMFIVWVQRRITRRYSHSSITGKGYRPRPLDLGKWKWLALGICLTYFLLAVVLPSFSLLYVSLQRFFTGTLNFSNLTFHHYREVLFSYPITWRAFRNSLILSGGGAALGIVLSSVVSYIVIKGSGRGRGLLESLAMLPAAIPGLVISVGLLWAYIHTPIYGTIFILLVSYITHYLPQGTRIISSNLVQLDDSLVESGRIAGGSWLGTLKDIVIPLMRPAVVSGWMLLFVAFFRELSSAVLLYTHGNEVLSVAIWDLHLNGNLGMLGALAILMLIVIYGIFFLIQWLGGSMGKEATDS